MNIQFNLKMYNVFLVCVFIFGLSNAAQSQITVPDTELKMHISKAIGNNPGLGELQSRITAAEFQVTQAGVWQDPTIGFGLMNLPTNSFDFNQEPMTGAWINVGQMIPLANKLELRTEIARDDLASKAIMLRSRELMIAENIAKTWYQWAFLREALKTLDNNIELIDNLIIVASSKYETGDGMQQDILMAETKRTQLDDKRANLLQSILTTSRKLAILLGQEPDNIPSSPESLLDVFSELNLKNMEAVLFQQNPQWLTSEVEIAEGLKKVELARRSVIPDLMLGAGYGFRQDADNGMERTDFFSISAGMTLPLHRDKKQNAAIQQMIATHRALVFKQDALKLDLKFKLNNLIDQDNRLAEQIVLHLEGIEPLSEATLASSTNSYSTGKADFEAILMAETNLFNARLERLARIRDRLQVRASLAALVGGENLIPTNKISD